MSLFEQICPECKKMVDLNMRYNLCEECIIVQLETELQLLKEANKDLEESAKYCPSCGYILPNHSEECGRYPKVVKELSDKLIKLQERVKKVFTKYEKLSKKSTGNEFVRYCEIETDLWNLLNKED